MCCQMLCAQQDPIALHEVVISDVPLGKFSTSQNVLTLSDSVISRNGASLSDLLRFNTPVYLKENGYGMVSSPAFRGTTAQQTAVVWNGININSQFNGQADFGAFSTTDFESISVRSGGGSPIYGSGAVGGTVHLANTFRFGDLFDHQVRLAYGSFETFNGAYKLRASNAKFSFSGGVSRNQSRNDYPWTGYKNNRKNENGQFYNTGMHAALGYRTGAHFLRLYSQTFDAERHFSVVMPSDTKTKYRELATRNLLEWQWFGGRFTSTAKVAFLSERYRYFEFIDRPEHSFGDVRTMLARYDLGYSVGEKLTLNAVVDFTQHNGSGSDILSQHRQIGSAALLVKHRPTARFGYELTVRKEATGNYDSPLLFSVGADVAPLRWYWFAVNVSRNFRIPTFNDLYWYQGGNPNLQPETSYQFEATNEFTRGGFKLTATAFQMQIRNMIRWLPGDGGWFDPQNTNSVLINGAEAALEYTRKIGRHRVVLRGTYAYTDSRNRETKKQLIYVPYHKATAAVAYSWTRFSVAYQHAYNGFVYTQSDNNPLRTVALSNVSNVMADFGLGPQRAIRLGVKALNVWNQAYESVAGRAMPGRHYMTYLTFNF